MIPPCFWSNICQNANGFFGCQDGYNGEGRAENHSTWFHFLVKRPTRSGSAGGISYEWNSMGFITKWSPPNRNVVICFDAPRALQTRLEEVLSSDREKREVHDPYALHSVIVDEVLAIYDSSVWSLRDLVRSVEQNRASMVPTQPNYPHLHEVARHTIHSTETLDVAIETLDSMIRQHEVFVAETSLNTNVASRQTRKYLQFQLKMFKAIRLRSQANGERLRNEISLAFNTVAQHDSRIAVRIGRAARADSAAMKTIAILTLVFLPGTYISAIFSMGFYNFTPGTETQAQKWSVSKDIWIYFAIAGPVTGVTVMSWLIWERWHSRKYGGL
ncbi:MAG: hypothetical protein M1813_009215 [Trichoglossum hirsutum]|nr:MAG: hypothetical protein M1813_009215 [Trichoglossum hirsutum]